MVMDEIVNKVEEYIRKMCEESGGIYEAGHPQKIADEIGVSFDEFLAARNELKARGLLYVTRGRKPKYSFSPFPDNPSTQKQKGIDLNLVQRFINEIDLQQILEEYLELKHFKERLSQPVITKNGKQKVYHYTLVIDDEDDV